MNAQSGQAAPAFMCRCEELTAADVTAAIDAGARTINDVKWRTRAGMGMCQGAYCLTHVAELLVQELEQPRASIAPMTARPPGRVISLSALGKTMDGE